MRSIQNYQIDSKVLELKGTVTKDLEFINKALNNPKQIELIFRGSEHGFRASEFHRLCDNTEDTFVLVRTEFGRTVAGYTHYKWNEMPNGNYVKDSARRAFLLLLDLQEKLVPIKDDQLICNLTTYGPIFGGGCDFVITDNCNTNCSGCNVGNTYNHEGTNKYVLQHPTTYAAICGRP